MLFVPNLIPKTDTYISLISILSPTVRGSHRTDEHEPLNGKLNMFLPGVTFFRELLFSEYTPVSLKNTCEVSAVFELKSTTSDIPRAGKLNRMRLMTSQVEKKIMNHHSDKYLSGGLFLFETIIFIFLRKCFVGPMSQNVFF